MLLHIFEIFMTKRIIIILCMITTAYAGEIDGTRTYAKFRWKYKKAISSWNFKPYIYEEIRYNFIPDYVDRYRIAIGVESRPIKRTTFDFKIYK